MLPTLALGSVVALAVLLSAARADVQRFGGWAFIDHGNAPGQAYGTPEPWMKTSTNLMFFAFIDPSTMAVPESFAKEAKNYDASKTLIIFSVGGQDYGDRWNWLKSEDQAKSMAAKVATWRKTYGCHGIDLDAEEGSVMNLDYKIMGAFISELKRLDPGVLVSLDVYGSPGGRDYHNNLINEYLLSSGSHPNSIDWINVMAYSPYQSTVTYVEYYTKAVYSPWYPTLKGPVPASKVVVGIAGTGYYSGNCQPDDYTSITGYVREKGLMGESVWAFIYTGSPLSSSWWTPNCNTGYVAIYNALVGGGPQPTVCSAHDLASCPASCQKCSSTGKCIEAADQCAAQPTTCSASTYDQCPSTCFKCEASKTCVDSSSSCTVTPTPTCASFTLDQCPATCKKCAATGKCMGLAEACVGTCATHTYLECPSGCLQCAWTQSCKEVGEDCTACTTLKGSQCNAAGVALAWQTVAILAALAIQVC
eukprot:m51a1_g1513 hypothetical protein (477) ;mRNA; f:409880-411566